MLRTSMKPTARAASDTGGTGAVVDIGLTSSVAGAHATAQHATRSPSSSRTRSGGRAVDAVHHAQFAAPVDERRVAVVVDHGLVVAVHGDVVDDVVGDDDVRRTLQCHAPAGALGVDGVAGAGDVQRGVVAIQG